MRIAAFSDTHGNISDMRDAIGRFGRLDLLVHLGDGICDGRQVAEASGIAFRGVWGNNDHGGTMLPDQAVIELQGWQFLLTHGHETDMNPYNPEPVWQTYLREMAARAKDLGTHAFLFGHAHKPVLQQENGIVLCNPGDQHTGTNRPSFALISWSVNGPLPDLQEKTAGNWIFCGTPAHEKLESHHCDKSVTFNLQASTRLKI